MTELPWFKFSPSEWLSGAISDLDYGTQGLFIATLSRYWKAGCILDKATLKRRLKLDDTDFDAFISDLIEDEIISINDDQITIMFLDEQYHTLKERHEKLSAAGKKGGSRSKPPRSRAEATPKHKEEEVEEDKEREEEIDPALNSLNIDDLRIHCYVGDGEAGAFEKLFSLFTGKQGQKVIEILTARREKNGQPTRPCLSDLSPYIKKNFNQIKEW